MPDSAPPNMTFNCLTPSTPSGLGMGAGVSTTDMILRYLTYDESVTLVAFTDNSSLFSAYGKSGLRLIRSGVFKTGEAEFGIRDLLSSIESFILND
jgi:hypothetical protein